MCIKILLIIHHCVHLHCVNQIINQFLLYIYTHSFNQKMRTKINGILWCLYPKCSLETRMN